MNKTHEKMVELHGAEPVMRAHQYLYYVMNVQVLSDYEYDKFCDQNGLFGGGGSDREQDYNCHIKQIADEIFNPTKEFYE